MATTNLASKSINGILFQQGNGTPNHTAPRGSKYLDLDTGLWSTNSDGATSWQGDGTTSVIELVVGPIPPNIPIPAGVNTTINTTYINKPLLVNIQSNSTQNRFVGAFPIGGTYRSNAVRQFNTTSFIVQTNSNGDFTVFANGNNCFAGIRAIFDQ